MDSGGSAYDVVVAGGGHNGLTAAAYLARAGLSVLVLERLDHTGGAAISAPPFAGFETRVSRYSHLVSLLPAQVVQDLGLDLELRSRPTASYTPVVRNGKPVGLHVEREEGDETRRSFAELTGSDAEYDAWRAFYSDVAGVAAVVFPTLLSPLPLERDVRERVDKGVWRDLVAQPLGVTIEERFSDDTVRGVVAADALIGTFASMHDDSLVQNRCFLYHRLGGDWRVPVGGMGALTTALAKAAADAGAEVVTGAGVSSIRAGDDGAEVTWHDGSSDHTVAARFVLANVAPWVLHILMGEPDDDENKPQGAQLKIDFLLDRLPRLKSGMNPEVAFAGSLHVGQDYSRLEAAYADAAAGRVPTSMPGEVSCPSLTDPSILGDVPEGTHILTYVGLHTPASLFENDPDAKELAVRRAIESLDEHLAEPLLDCVTRDADGRPCIDATTPQDLEQQLAMPGGHIFHGQLDWPWAPNRARLDTPAQQWGVQTDVPSVLLCGSGARRGGAVSAIGGHNAAQAVLAMR
ncbi:MAG TPA: NAD(P)/FAD-dependent oxidoreductase [Nocardioides sp.]|nr:NAD(P)/FAD-dependent oxidoreductase [Nocardioides sp.]